MKGRDKGIVADSEGCAVIHKIGCENENENGEKFMFRFFMRIMMDLMYPFVLGPSR